MMWSLNWSTIHCLNYEKLSRLVQNQKCLDQNQVDLALLAVTEACYQLVAGSVLRPTLIPFYYSTLKIL